MATGYAKHMSRYHSNVEDFELMGPPSSTRVQITHLTDWTWTRHTSLYFLLFVHQREGQVGPWKLCKRDLWVSQLINSDECPKLIVQLIIQSDFCSFVSWEGCKTSPSPNWFARHTCTYHYVRAFRRSVSPHPTLIVACRQCSDSTTIYVKDFDLIGPPEFKGKNIG